MHDKLIAAIDDLLAKAVDATDAVQASHFTHAAKDIEAGNPRP